MGLAEGCTTWRELGEDGPGHGSGIRDSDAGSLVDGGGLRTSDARWSGREGGETRRGGGRTKKDAGSMEVGTRHNASKVYINRRERRVVVVRVQGLDRCAEPRMTPSF